MKPPLLVDALAAVRKANATVDTMQTNEFIINGEERASMLSTLRIELSVAAGKIAQHLDDDTPPALVVIDGGAT